MKVAIFTPRLKSKGTERIYEAFINLGVETHKIKLSSIRVNLASPKLEENSFNQIFGNHINIKDIDGALSRGIGINKTKKIYFRLGIYRSIELCGIPLINSKECLETATNKMLTSQLLKINNIKTPETYVCENYKDVLELFEKFNTEMILKPMFGSKGIGVIKLNDKDFAESVFYNLNKFDEPFYIQKYYDHNNQDIRIFVLGDQVIGGMKRVADSWKTNISKGGISKPIEVSDDLKEIAIKSSQAVGGKITGVDIINTENGYYVIEVNAVPGFIGLQEVVKSDIAEEIAKFCIEEFKR